ncbi:P-loop NTPase fold protein [Oenococcus sicerae]|uniref:KAP NTPase domain-containing protein n=1 Tax=Oenococcus sicerae TaxID=2203724 RepID=A0AAJ1RBM2_9LACO|nr:P-loop NTPase fold protein [Oenococcus sicerae]MDN6900658.1 hypothetical protein [Oenococcus sicerae]
MKDAKRNGIKDYIKQVAKKYRWWNMIAYAIIVVALIGLALYSQLSHGTRLFWLAIFAACCILAISKWQPNRRFLSPFINQIDEFFFVANFVFFAVMLLVLFKYWSQIHAHLWTIAIFIGLVTGLVISLSYCFVSKREGKIMQTNEHDSLTSVLDLDDIYNAKGPQTVDLAKSFLVKENAVNYDLLKRSGIINDLKNTIQSFNSNEKFIIGIEGKWGSGKTSIIQNALQNLNTDTDNFVIVRDFEPWIYKDQMSLVDNLFRQIFGQDSLHLSEQQITGIINLTTSLILGDQNNFFINKLLSSNVDKSAELSEFQTNIGHLLEHENKKIILVIDNLDRISADNIFLILNLVNNVLRIKNLLVILLYDEVEIKHALDHIGISSGYLDKIVQKRIILPVQSPDDLMPVYTQVLQNITEQNNIDFDVHSSNANKIIHFMAQNMDLREFKRFLNSAITPYLGRDKKLYFPDYLIIEIIKFSNFTLYQNIFVNRKYFILNGLDLQFSFGPDRQNEIKKEYEKFFSKLFDTDANSKYSELLSLSFSSVSETMNKHIPFLDATSIQKNRRMTSGNFFNAYFVDSYNSIQETLDFAEELVKQVNNSQSAADSIFDSLFAKPLAFRKGVLRSFNLYIDDLNPNSIAYFANKILSIYLDPKFYLPIDRDFKTLISQITASISINMKTDNFKAIISNYIRDPRYLFFLYSLSHAFEIDRRASSNDENVQNKIAYINGALNQLIQNILSNKVPSLYEKEIYSRSNSYVIGYVLKENPSDQYLDIDSTAPVIKEYNDSHLTEETLYRVLNELVTEGRVMSGGTSPYAFSMYDSYKNYVDDEKLIRLLSKNPPKNEKESFLKKVFDARDKQMASEIPSDGQLNFDVIDF